MSPSWERTFLGPRSVRNNRSDFAPAHPCHNFMANRLWGKLSTRLGRLQNRIPPRRQEQTSAPQATFTQSDRTYDTYDSYDSYDSYDLFVSLMYSTYHEIIAFQESVEPSSELVSLRGSKLNQKESQNVSIMRWVFPKIGVPQNGWFIIGYPYFRKHPDVLQPFFERFRDSKNVVVCESSYLREEALVFLPLATTQRACHRSKEDQPWQKKNGQDLPSCSTFFHYLSFGITIENVQLYLYSRFNVSHASAIPELGKKSLVYKRPIQAIQSEGL